MSKIELGYLLTGCGIGMMLMLAWWILSERVPWLKKRVRLRTFFEPDLSRCPKCGGPADNGHDRGYPPSPYYCTKCAA